MANGREEGGRPKEKEVPERERKEREQQEKWIRKIEPPSDLPADQEPTPDTDDGGNEISKKI
jgi:hypothetical protein